MTTPADWTGRRVVVVGGARSGAAAAELLAACGATVVVTDMLPGEELPALAALEAVPGVELVLGDHPDTLWEGAELCIASPGIPPGAPPFTAARRHGLAIVSEIEVAAGLAGAPVVAITGSNGKSTVTSMTGQILERAGRRVAVCGNIGLPFSRAVHEELFADRAVDRYVLEVSSFQTETVQEFHPRWSAILNISADHLDRHGTLEAYAAAKLGLLRNATSDDWLVHSADDELLGREVLKIAARRTPFAARALDDGPAAWTDGESLWWWAPDADPVQVLPTAELGVLGRCNQLNACAAIALACLAGADIESAAAALAAFRGLEHRMEPCGEIAGVVCINDSKATNLGATEAALAGFDERIWLILGGRDKGADFARLRPLLRDRVRRVLLVGEASGRIASSLHGAVPMDHCGTLDVAVDRGLEAAAAGDVLLLAPACTSFDQYDDFEQRGRHFKAIVRERGTSAPAVARKH